MSRDNQIEEQAIEEMARVIETTEQVARDAHCGLPSPKMYAKDLYWKGYRKQSQPYSCGHEKGGEWIAHRDPFDICATDFVCSACKESFCSSELTDEEFFEMMKCCPNCGARMGGDDNDA